MKTKLSKLEKSWILYDVGNSAFTLLISTIIPIYFNTLAENSALSSVDYLAYFGYATSIATLCVAVLGPVLGTLSDTKNFKRNIFMVLVILGAAGCALMGWISHWLTFLIIFVIARVAYSTSLVLYDSMLVDVATNDDFDRVSSNGYAYGYIGSCIPFIICLVLILGGPSLGIPTSIAMISGFAVVAIWWVACTIPLLKHYKQKHYIEKSETFNALTHTFRRLYLTLKSVKQQKHIFLFFIAYFFYIDGVYTIIDMATAYGTALGLDATGLLLALLVTQIVAFPSSIIFGRLCNRHDIGKLIRICIYAYCGIAIYALFLTQQWQFWLLAVAVGMFQGGIQAMSRSYFTKIIPAEKSGEYFGLLDICGKGASFIGTALISLSTQLFNSVNIGLSTLVIVFLLGLFFFNKAYKLNKN